MSDKAINIISTLSIVVPIILGILGIRRAGTPLRLFVCFLIFGLSVDLFGWYYSYHQEIHTIVKLAAYIFLFYSIVEALFFAWLIANFSFSRPIKRISYYLIIVICVWALYLLSRDISVEGPVSFFTMFDVFYQISISFLAGFLLLRIVENEETIGSRPIVWIFIGIFFYCFSTFFIFVVKSIIGEMIADQLWKVHNACNVSTYVFYSIGLLKLSVKKLVD